MKVPVLGYDEFVRALRRAGWSVVRQRGSHIRLQHGAGAATRRLTVPAHKPLKRSTLAHLLKQAGLTVDQLIGLL